MPSSLMPTRYQPRRWSRQASAEPLRDYQQVTAKQIVNDLRKTAGQLRNIGETTLANEANSLAEDVAYAARQRRGW